jgi:hypothetical protein
LAFDDSDGRKKSQKIWEKKSEKFFSLELNHVSKRFSRIEILVATLKEAGLKKRETFFRLHG